MPDSTQAVPQDLGESAAGRSSAPARLVVSLVLLVAFWAGSPSEPRVAGELPSLAVDVNTAPRPVLLALPRLGPSLVDRIEAERARAPFASVEDLDDRVDGFGPATIESVRPHLRFAPDSPPARSEND